MQPKVISIATDFSRHPAGRFAADGPFSGARFRDEVLTPEVSRALSAGGKVLVDLDGTRGYGSSFLEEAFGGLAREMRYSPDELLRALSFKSQDDSLIVEIKDYIANADVAAEVKPPPESYPPTPPITPRQSGRCVRPRRVRRR